MTSLLILTGLLLPTACGWLLLGLLQNTKIILFKGERLGLGFLLGTTTLMFLFFCIHIVFGIKLSLWGFLGIYGIATAALLAATLWLRLPLLAGRAAMPAERASPLLTFATILLGAWTAVKIALPAVTFLLLTPTYFDDAADNWNLRAKVFHETQSLELVLPGRGTEPADVSSYPPTVPLAKTWMAAIVGWSDPAVSAIHLAWFLSALALLYYALRRYVARAWSLLGVYLIVSVPLYLMHGTNPYADVFMGAHVFAAVSFLFHAIRTDDGAERRAFLAIGGVAAALLPFTKNEGLLLFLPPVLLLLAVHLGWEWRKRRTTPTQILSAALWYAVPLLLVLIPWLGYKFAHGLPFGNAKAVSDLAFGWQDRVLSAVWVNTLFEGNWLLLFPLLAGLVAWCWKTAFGPLLPLTAFFLIVYVGQLLLYLFTGLSVEAVMQTGYARGILQLLPVMTFLTVVLLKDGYDRLRTG